MRSSARDRTAALHESALQPAQRLGRRTEHNSTSGAEPAHCLYHDVTAADTATATRSVSEAARARPRKVKVRCNCNCAFKSRGACQPEEQRHGSAVTGFAKNNDRITVLVVSAALVMSPPHGRCLSGRGLAATATMIQIVACMSTTVYVRRPGSCACDCNWRALAFQGPT